MSTGGAIKGRYEKRQVLGEGGMGVVYRAYDADLKREVALKTLRDGGDELALEMFRKECGVLASLNHPNIVDIYDVGQFTEEGLEKPYFVMPLLPGTTLDRIIKNEPQRLTVDRTVEIISQTCRGLHAAHERGLIHRDLKPSNIFVLADDSVKIIDFGIAHLTGTHTSLGLKGTVYYMAPEQMEMKPASPQSDIYSLGIVCFEILGRRRPFMGANRDEVIRAILRGTPPPVHELNPLVSQALSQVIHAALAKKPYHRYQTSREFSDCLQKALRNQPLERFNPDKIEPRIQKVEKALASQEFEFANEILSELEEEGQLHPDIRGLRNRLDTTVRDRTIGQLMESAKRRLVENEYQLALQKVQEVLQLDPRHAGALGLRADIESRRSTEQIDGWVRLARQHLDNQKFSLAREALGNALAINPQDTSAIALRGEIERSERTTAESRSRKRELYEQAKEAWQRGDVTAALSKIERVIDVDRLAQTAGGEGDLAATYQAFYNKVRSERDTIQASYEEAKNHIANGNFSAAGAVCDDVLARYPNHALFQALRFDVGEGLRQALSADMARVDREVDAEPDLDRRVKILEEAVARHPGEAHFKHALQGVSSKRDLVNSISAKARSLEETGHFQEAISQWEILRSINPQFPGLDFEIERLKKRREQQARMDAKARWAERIDGALNAGDHPRALELVTSALEEFPDDPELTALEKLARHGHERSREGQDLIAQGQELRKAGRLSEAVSMLRKAAMLDERSAAARAALVDALVAQAGAQIEHDWNSADGWIDQALALDSNHTQARSLKTLVGDKRREAGVNETLAKARELQGAGNLRAAYQEVLAGLAAYPLDKGLTQLKNQLSKTIEETDRANAPKQAPPPPPPPPTPPSQQPTVRIQLRPEHMAPPPQATSPTLPQQPRQPAAVTPRPPNPHLPQKPVAGKPPLWIAAVVVPILAGVGGWFLFHDPPPPPPPPAAKPVVFEVNVQPPSARVRVGEKDFGANRSLELPEGDYELEIYGEGIKPMRVPLKVSKGMAPPGPIEAQMEPPALLLVMSGALAKLDGKFVTAGQITLEPGDHKLLFAQGTGSAAVDFTIAAGAMPSLKTPVPIYGGMFLTVVSAFGGNAKVFGARNSKAGLGATEPGDVPVTGLDVTGLTKQPQPLTVSDGVEKRAYDLTSAAGPTLSIYITDPGRVDLTILSKEDGAGVLINGKQTGTIQRGQRLEQLTPGAYRVKLSKPGFTDTPEKVITLAKGRPVREQFELKPASGSLRIMGGVAGARVFVDGRDVGEIKAGENFVTNLETGRRVVSVRAESYLGSDHPVDARAGEIATVAWQDLAVGVGRVQLTVTGNLAVSYQTAAGGPPKAMAQGTHQIAVGDYTFRATAPGGADPQAKPVSVKLGETVQVAFAPLSRTPPAPKPEQTGPSGPKPLPPPVSSYGPDWKEDDDGWMKLPGGKQPVMSGAPIILTFQVQRKKKVLVFGGSSNWLYVLGSGRSLRFELGGDKLTWYLTDATKNARDKKVDSVAMPKDVEEVRIEITSSTITHLIGGIKTHLQASDVGLANFTGGSFRFQGPISTKGFSTRR